MAGLDTQTVGSPGWWLTRLHNRLVQRQARYNKLSRYYEGDHDLPEGDKRARDLWQAFQRKARTNYTGMLVDAYADRLVIEDFLSGSDGDEQRDAEAWRVFQANKLDADQDLVHSTAGWAGDAYVIVGANKDDPSTPLITPEDPRQVIAEFDPVRRRSPRAGLKMWIDEAAGKRHAVLYLPGSVHYFITEQPQTNMNRAEELPPGVAVTEGLTWGEEEPAEDNPLGEVPVVRFTVRPKMNGEGRGLLSRGAIDIQDRINDTQLSRLVITKMQAYRQRWAKGIKTEDEQGNELPLPFIPGVDMLWAVEDEGAEFGDFEQADIKPLLDAVKEDVTAFVIITALPPQYVAGNIVNAAADAIEAVTDRFNTMVINGQLGHGESWEQVLRLAAKTAGSDAAIAEDIEIQWKDPQRSSLAQKADAANKAATSGVPWRWRMKLLGYSPQEIDRMEADRASDAMMGMLTAPQPAPGAPQPAAGMPPKEPSPPAEPPAA